MGGKQAEASAAASYRTLNYWNRVVVSLLIAWFAGAALWVSEVFGLTV